MDKALIPLKVLYESIPETTGCEKCKESDGVPKHWCCRSSQPQVSKIEFSYLWSVVSKWSKDKLQALVHRALRGWTDNRTTCPFYSDGCTIYDHRPMVCRIFGIESESAYKHLKSQNKKTCSIVAEASGFRLTEHQRTNIWTGLVKLNEDRIKQEIGSNDIPPVTWEILISSGFSSDDLHKIKRDSFASNFDIDSLDLNSSTNGSGKLD